MCAKPSPRLAAVLQHLRSEFEIDGTELLDLMASLRANFGELQTAMHDSLAHSQWQDLSRVGHSLKGVAGNIGQDDLKQLGYSLEVTAAEGDRAKAEPLVRQIDALLAEFAAPDGAETV